MKIFKIKEKKYLVSFSNNEVRVKAKNKKDAIQMVKDVINNCSLFNFNATDEIYCKRIRN